MVDIYDQATEREMQERGIALSEALNNKVVISAVCVCPKCGVQNDDTCQKCAVDAIGICIECGDQIAVGLRWCDKDCRDDWQRWNPGA